MVGDDRQLGAVSVGGAMGALVERHGGIVHALDQNVRQHNEAERAALVELRAGDVTRAVEFYLANGRVVTERTRDEALDTLVDQWARDTLAGQGRRHVRLAAGQRGRAQPPGPGADGSRGTTVRVPSWWPLGEPAYAAGDRIVTLAPAAEGQVVTSERGVVTAVDLEAQRLAIETEDGKRYWFEQEAIGQSKLAHGYATTVHRSQGATHDIAHVYEDGGGRELAYVAMSRAREETHVYLAADDLDQAREDLCRSWETERRWKWAIDTGSVQTDTPGTPSTEIASLRQRALKAERDALAAAIPKDINYLLRQAGYELNAAQRELASLRKERGWRSGGELGRAAGELVSARQRAFQNERSAANKDYSRAIRRDARRWAQADLDRVQVAEERLEKLLLAEERKLTGNLDGAKQKVGDITHEISERERWMTDNPKALTQLTALEKKWREVEHENDHERWNVEGELNPRPVPAPAIEHSRSQDRSHSIDHDRDYGFGM